MSGSGGRSAWIHRSFVEDSDGARQRTAGCHSGDISEEECPALGVENRGNGSGRRRGYAAVYPPALDECREQRKSGFSCPIEPGCGDGAGNDTKRNTTVGQSPTTVCTEPIDSTESGKRGARRSTTSDGAGTSVCNDASRRRERL